MSTRRLIAVALLCGLAILVAGGIQLFRISKADDRTVEVLAEGEPGTVGSVTVVVQDSARVGSDISAIVRLSASTDTSVPLSSFTLLVGGQLQRARVAADGGQPACGSSIAVGEVPTTCTLVFAGRGGTATLGFSRDGGQVLWRLDLGAS